MQQHNRRNFLKRGSLLGATAMAASLIDLVPSNAKASSESVQSKNKTRTLGSGKNSLTVNYGMGLGCMGMTFNRSFVPDKKPMIALIRKAYENGVNLFDTAEAYGPFTDEMLVGEAIKPFRKNIILCTKFGFDIQNNKMTGGLNSDPKHIREVVDQSLKRLDTDYIDLLYQHRVDPKIPMEDVAGTVQDLIRQGKVKHWGLSEADPASIRKAHAVQPLTALQSEFSLMTKEPLNDVIPVCEEIGIGFVPWSPLGRAYLTGYINERTKYNPDNDNRPTLPRYKPESVIANWDLVNILAEFGNQRGLTPAQVALAWLMAQKPWIVPIPGTTKQAHLQENLWSTDFEFTPDELKTFTDAISAVKVTSKSA